MRPIDLILIGHTATPDGAFAFVRELDARDAAAGLRRDPQARERCNPELGSIGWHIVVYPNGAPASGRHLEEIGGAARGYNAHSVQVALVGSERYTPAQWRMLRELAEILGKRFPGSAFKGHGELPGHEGAGPGFSVQAWLDGGLNPLWEHTFVSKAA